MRYERSLTMPPATRFNKDAIVDAAFNLAKEKGLSGISARAVAKALGCSVAPIYECFATMEDFRAAVVQRVFALSDQLLATQSGPHLFENIGKASLAFAREYPALFRELVLEPNPYMVSYDQVEKAMLSALAKDKTLASWSTQDRRRLFLKMRIFQLGLSAMTANGHLPSWIDEQEVEQLLLETGDELMAARENKPRTRISRRNPAASR
jgi:AcrR family transcriptional regulator